MGYIVGGYYLIQGAKPKAWMNAKLLPPVIWSACSYVCEKVPDAWIFTSLICGSMEQDIVDNYGVRFNSYGLIDSIEKTLPIVRDIRSGALPAEEGYWASWLISEYPLT